MARLKWENRDIADVVALMDKAIFGYRLIEDGDKVLIGVSGGKDSLALLELLARRSRIRRPSFTVMAAHVAVTNIGYRSDIDYLRSLCEGFGVELVTVETSYEMATDTRKSPCFLCSWNRRKALFTVAQRHGCNKIALGHHQDDVIETLYMNMMFQGAFSTMPPMLRMRKFDLAVIRPLCLVPESRLVAMAASRGYKGQVKACPYEHQSSRTAVKHLLKEMEALNPEMRHNIWGSMSNVQTEMLPPKIIKHQKS